MILIDSDLIIYAAAPANSHSRDFIRDHSPFVSIISKIEVLGYPGLTPDAQNFFEKLFDASVVLPITEMIAERAISLRRQKRIKLGDSLIAATALDHGLSLATNNVKDYKWINGLTLIDSV